MGFTLFVDESGDAGISKLRTGSKGGSSLYMTMGGVLVRNDDIPGILEKLNDFRESITKQDSLHCCKLCHERKVNFGRFLATQPLLCFGVISHKKTLGSYKETIGDKHTHYYNKCAQYLLERVGMFVKLHKEISADNLNIVFEKGNFDYNKMRGLICSCQNNPLQQNTKNLRFIDANKIVEREKSEEPLLQLADLVSHTLYRCVEGGEFGVIECRYLNEIRDKFYQDKETNKAIGKGIYVVHKLKDLELDEYSHSFLNEF